VPEPLATHTRGFALCSPWFVKCHLTTTTRTPLSNIIKQTLSPNLKLDYLDNNEIMFGAFRYSKTTNEYDHVELSNDDTVDARGYAIVACDLCRAQKVRNVNRC
jgi:hypothetical protein